MLEILKFVFSSGWVFIGSILLLTIVSVSITKIIVSYFKYLTITLRGWPSYPIDEDEDEKSKND